MMTDTLPTDAAQSDRNEAARAILIANDRGGYTVPTAGLYPYQWNWDSAFASLGFAEFDISRAWQEIETLFSGQWDSGMVPHILFHKPDPGYFPGPDVWGCAGPIPSSGITQPPVALSFATRLLRADPEFGKDRFAALFSKMRAWGEWFLKWRRDEKGAIFVVHPWESGRDNAPDWDDAMSGIDPQDVGFYERRDTQHVDASMRPTKYDYDRYIWLVQRAKRLGWDDAAMAEDNPFRVADPTMHFILLRGMRDLLAAGEELGLDTDGLAGQIAELEAGAESLWNPGMGFYDSYNCNNGIWSNALTNASFLCWFAGLSSPHMETHLQRVLDAAPYGVPSLAPFDPRFDAKRYWRGPTWGMMNMMIGEGATEQGFALGEEVRKRTREVISKYGFVEYFDPMTGEAAGGKAFTWTAAVWLAWAGKEG
ncbi:MGH1-like glycoside hydrolase domain-containing protein [Thioclava atlantica]|uniref:Mannosylglycerate hydrolase MGH1-like glycoside hydrolase domain-containing protein n=1 Tax=Thioclava atlantica TaxID=1317124 RepID=A0A085TTB0_9RHOB|nr:hypothetical protein [Thioclava atlantica]KFE33957.1 hypothetical protein DW2_15865 [Thioclava atlantica]